MTVVTGLNFIPVSEVIDDLVVTFCVRVPEKAKGLVGKNHSKAKGVVGLVPLEYSNFILRVLFFRQNGKVQAGRSTANNVGFHALRFPWLA